MRPPRCGLLLLVAFLLALGACARGSDPSPISRTVGFIFVGERDDLGYNQATWQGSEALARRYPDLTILRAENVPETDEARAVMEDMIDQGAGLLFATSFGHLDAARAVAEAHPDVVVVHQGGVEGEPDLPNLGTYFGSHHEFMYAAGIAAAHDAREHRDEPAHLGFIVAFPIPAAYANVDAFTLGAQTVDPDVSVDVVFTGSWCDPDAQTEAMETLLARDVEAVALHQDCTRTLLGLAEEAGIGIVGYHADGSEVAPDSWIVGAVWNWDRLMIDITQAYLDGRFAESPYAGDFRGTLRGGDNPASLTEAGPRVSAATVAEMDAALADFARGVHTPFDGPMIDLDGVQRHPLDEPPSIVAVDALDYFVQGVVVVDGP